MPASLGKRREVESNPLQVGACRFAHDFSGVRVGSPVPPSTMAMPWVGAPGDSWERAADRAAEALVPARAPLPGATAPRAGAQPLPSELREHFEARLGQGLGHVRLHSDARASRLAGALRARAVTARSDVYFAENEYAPWSAGGQRLLAHELAHVIQQGSTAAVQRQEIPVELQSSADPTAMSEAELHQRYDMLIRTMGAFNQSTPETVPLEEEAGRIGAELTRRALAAGRTFAPDAMERMRKYFIQNAKKPKPRNCIDTMNDGLRLLYSDKQQAVDDSVDRTMRALQGANRAGAAREIEFEDPKGKVSKSGALFPFKVHESVWDALLQMAGGDFGWSVFGMGPADMSHSVTLTLDNHDPSQPVVYWSDQWSSKGGWKQYDKAGLDAAVAEVTQIIWNKKDEKHKPSTKVTLWRLRTEAKAPPAPNP